MSERRLGITTDRNALTLVRENGGFTLVKTVVDGPHAEQRMTGLSAALVETLIHALQEADRG